MIGIVYGGESCEHDISIITALSINNKIKYRMDTMLIYMRNGVFYIGKKLEEICNYKDFSYKGLKRVIFQNGYMYILNKYTRKKIAIECVLMCNHGGVGENGSLSGFFETVGIPYTASGVFGSSLCMDKVYSKLLLEKFKFPVVPYRIFNSGYKVERVDNWEYPLIVKPARLGSSIGISVVKDSGELDNAIRLALQYDNKLLIEQALNDFKEFNCAVYAGDDGIVVSDVEEVFLNNPYLNFNDKYIASNERGRKIPADIPVKVSEKIRRMTKEIYLLFELKGVVRIDYLYANEKLYVNEINTIPGSLSGYMFKNIGISTENLILQIINFAKKEFADRQKLLHDFSSDVLRHYDGIKSNGIKK